MPLQDQDFACVLILVASFPPERMEQSHDRLDELILTYQSINCGDIASFIFRECYAHCIDAAFRIVAAIVLD